MVEFFSLNQPPSSSGLGHSPLKAKTGVRVPVGVFFFKYQYSNCLNKEFPQIFTSPIKIFTPPLNFSFESP